MAEPVLDLSDIVDLYKEDVRRMVGVMQASLSRWNEVVCGGAARQDLRRLSHQLRGSGRTYGFSDVTRLSKAIESLIQKIEKNKVPPDERARESLRGKV